MSAPFLHAQIHSPSTTSIIYTPPQRSQKKDFEVLFCSADHSEEEFDSYYNENMPNWLAVPYDESEREAIMSMYQGNRINASYQYCNASMHSINPPIIIIIIIIIVVSYVTSLLLNSINPTFPQPLNPTY